MTKSSKDSTKIQFIQYHKPSLQAGKYEIELTQTIQSSKIADQKPFKTDSKTFYVAGDRFTLNPQDIYSVFPPAGSLGDHSNVLPHIILNRSTLPWERTVNGKNEKDSFLPWLALLLFDESEKLEPQIITLKQLKNDTVNIKFPTFELEPGQHDDDQVTIIDVKNNLLPTVEDLKYLAHVRQGYDDQENLTNEFAVIIGNRLPDPKGISVVHLVSLEGQFNGNSFNFQDSNDNDLIRLVSLKSWSFSCTEKEHIFKELLKKVNQNPSTLMLPDSKQKNNQNLTMGYVPLHHYLRQGGKTISWYRSPLATGNNSTDIKLPIRSSDELIRYNPAIGMFDVSYAAAWELGRLLALQNKGFSVSLYRWKRSQIQQLKQQKISSEQKNLPLKKQPPISSKIPDDISLWFNNLSLLKGVPFNYLVPDEKMLPIESIRFFWIDPLWIECLLDGAFSIGRVTRSDHKHDRENPAGNPHELVTGFLLRSDVVSGWPGLLVDGYDKIVDNNSSNVDEGKLPLLRMDRLSANVLICLFQGEVKTVDIHQKPETLHFGFDLDNQSKTFYKKLKNLEGQQIDKKIDNIPWKYPEKRVININTLANCIKCQVENISTVTSAQFALEMIEDVEKVRFTAISDLSSQ